MSTQRPPVQSNGGGGGSSGADPSAFAPTDFSTSPAAASRQHQPSSTNKVNNDSFGSGEANHECSNSTLLLGTNNNNNNNNANTTPPNGRPNAYRTVTTVPALAGGGGESDGVTGGGGIALNPQSSQQQQQRSRGEKDDDPSSPPDFTGRRASMKASRTHTRANSVVSVAHAHKEHLDPIEAKERQEDAANQHNVRRINVLDADGHDASKTPFISNYIKTTKYSVIPFSRHFFLWKNIFEQFQRKANLYFLIIGSLQLIPGISPTGQFTTLVTLLAVMAFSMLKSAYEDYQRFLKDSEINSKVAYVLREVPVNSAGQMLDAKTIQNLKKNNKSSAAVEGNTTTTPYKMVPRFVQVKYTDVRVGDIVRVLNVDTVAATSSSSRNNNTGNTSASRNNGLPCDLMLLTSADADGAAYVETSNLDGETNLKPRFCIDKLKLDSETVVTMLSNTRSSADAFALSGHRPSADPTQAPPKGLGDVEMAAFISADYTPMNSGLPSPQNGTLAMSKLDIGGIEGGGGDALALTQQHNHHHPRKPSTAIQCWQKYKGCRIECEVPNGHLYTFAGNFITRDGEKFGITPAQMLYRGTNLRKVPWVVGVSINTGAETKVMMNARSPPHKSSRVEALVNWLLIAVLILQAFMVLVCAIVIVLMPEDEWYLGEDDKHIVVRFLMGVVTFAILFNNLIPISLYVSMEMIKFMQGRLMEWDLCMYYQPKDMRATAKTTDLNEELGQINYIFSDKTGTLTCNVMTFMKFCCKGVVFGSGITEIGRAAAMRRGEHVVDTRPEEVIKSDFPFFDDRISDDKWWTDTNADAFRQLFTILAVCHTVVLDQGRYEAESPDEEALVKAAKALGIKFVGRNTDTITLEIGSSAVEEEITVLEVIPFDSDRKRMSVLVKLPKDQGYRLFMKGADNVMLERVARQSSSSSPAAGAQPQPPTATATATAASSPFSPSSPSSPSSSSFDYEQETLAALKQFGEEGLRVLVLASKVISEPDALRWSMEYRAAKEIIGDDERRDKRLASLAAEIERDMSLVGVTAIEDKLQDGVPQAMEAFRGGGIKVWMLTGDKIETAINIGYACSLLFTDCRLSTFFGGMDEALLATQFEEEMAKGEADGNTKPHSVVIDGDALAVVLGDEDLRESFYQMVRHCVSVVCCRVSPKQKAMVVNLIREKEASCVSLAVGDGANDVPMIQSAHVGVGISGMEGQQAANAADYSVGQFRYLHRLLMVHGRVNYHRLALTINYFFYKNALLVMTQFWFCIFNRFTGQSLYEKWTLSCYNLVFTSLPIIIVGSLDRDVLNTDNIIALPQLYLAGLRSDYLNVFGFVRWLVNAIAHSAIVFFVVMFGWGGDGVNSKGTTGGLDTVGLVMMAVLVAVVNCKLAIHTNSFSWVQHLFIWGTVLFFFLFAAVLGALPTTFGSTMYGNVQNILTFTTPWLFFFLATVITLLPDFFIMYGGTNFLKKNLRMLVQYADGKDSMASIRPPQEIRKKRKAAAGASILTTKALSSVGEGTTAALADSNGAKSAAIDGQSEQTAFAAGSGDKNNKDAKLALFQRTAKDEDDEIDTSQGVFLGFIDTEIEDEFLIYYYGTGFRYKFALGMCAVVSILLLAVSIYGIDGKDEFLEPVMWGLSALVCWIGFLIVTCFKSIDLRGPLHPIILFLTIIMFSSLSVANLLASQRDKKTHPVTMATIMLGLITVLRPPFFHGLQYSIVAIASFVGFSFAVKVDEWTNIDIALRAVEIFIVVVTAMIGLVMSESFSRKMFVSQMQAKIASKAARREENRSLVLLGNVLPSAIVFEVRTNNHKLNQFSLKYDLASTLNSDIVKFTNFSSTKEPHVVVEMLNKMFTLFDSEAKLLGLEKIKTVGDAYVCAGGVPVKDDLHQEKILYMGMRMLENIKELNRQGLTTLRDLDIQIRVGVATGSVSAGVVGMQKVCYEVFGDCAEKSELMEQTGLPSHVHAHADIVNTVTKKMFNFKEIDGQFFVDGIAEGVNVKKVFFGINDDGVLVDGVAAEAAKHEPQGLPEALKSHMQLNRNDIYSFLEDEDLERRTTIRLWGKFQGEMQTGFLNFKNELAESEYRHYARLLSIGRFTPEIAQGTYLFSAMTLLFALYYEDIVIALILVCLFIGLAHFIIFLINLIYHFLRRNKIIGGGGASSSQSNNGSSVAATNGGGGKASSGGGGISNTNAGATSNDDDDDEVDGANAMMMIQRVSKRRSTVAIHRPQSQNGGGIQQSQQQLSRSQGNNTSGGENGGGGGGPNSARNNNAGLRKNSSSRNLHVSIQEESGGEGGENGGANGGGRVRRASFRSNALANATAVDKGAEGDVDDAEDEYEDADVNGDGNNNEIDDQQLIQDASGDDHLPLCTPIRFYALVSGAAALVVPVVAFYVFNHISVVNVFVILSAQCYVLTMLHVRIPFKFVLSILHLVVVLGSFFYATLVNDDSFTLTKDGGNLAALVMCYVLTFISAYITEQNVRKTFAAAKHLLYQNAETESSIALCDKILNNVLPRSIVLRMKEFPDRQIVDEVPDASVLFVYTDGLKHEHHAHRQRVQSARGGPSPSSRVGGGGANADDNDDDTGASAANAPEVIDSMNTFLWILDAITVKYGVEKIKTAPFLVVSGCPERRTDHPERLAMVAMEIIAAVRQFNHDTGSDFKIKVGIHSGRVTAGVLGSTKFLYDVFGDTVNFASRLTSSAQWGTIQISTETADRLRPKGFKIENKGTMELKGKGIQQVFLLKGKRASTNANNNNNGGGGGNDLTSSRVFGRPAAVAGAKNSNATTATTVTATVGGAGNHNVEFATVLNANNNNNNPKTTILNSNTNNAGAAAASFLLPEGSISMSVTPATTDLPGGVREEQTVFSGHDFGSFSANNNNNNTATTTNSHRVGQSVSSRFGAVNNNTATNSAAGGGGGDGGATAVMVGGGGAWSPSYNGTSGVLSPRPAGHVDIVPPITVDNHGDHNNREEGDDDDDDEDMMLMTDVPTVADLNRTLQAKRDREMGGGAGGGSSISNAANNKSMAMMMSPTGSNLIGGMSRGDLSMDV